MKKNYILTSLLITVSLISIAQTPPLIQWQKSLGGSGIEYGGSIEQTSDSGSIVAGYSESNDGDVSGNHGNSDYWIVKLNSSGTIQWQKSLGGSGYESPSSIKQTSDGGYIVAGTSTSNDGDVSGNHGRGDYWIVKLNGNGVIQWQKTLGGSETEQAYAIVQTSDGGYIVAGTSSSNDGDVSGNHDGRPDYGDYWIVKLNGSGAIEWQKPLGGSKPDIAFSIAQTLDGGYIVAGVTDSNDGDVSGNHDISGFEPDYWIVKLSNSGTIQWQKCLGGINWDEAYSVVQTTDGGYIVSGGSNSNDGDVSGNHGGFDCWVVKLNSSGNIEWQKCFGGSGSEYGVIKQTTDGGYVFGGNTDSNDGDVSGNHGEADYWTVKLSSNGTLQWQNCLGGSGNEFFGDIEETFDAAYIISGNSISNDGDVSGNHGVQDYWIVKLGADAALPVTLLNFFGEVQGKQNLLHWTTATEQNNTGFEVQRSSDGYSFNKIGFVNSKASGGNSNLKLNYDFSDIGYAASTNYYRLKQIDKDGKFSYSNIVVLKDINAIADGSMAVYPNPVKNILNVKIASINNSNGRLSITDISGKTILNKSTLISSGETVVQIDVSHLSAGAYFLKLISADGKEMAVKKFIK